MPAGAGLAGGPAPGAAPSARSTSDKAQQTMYLIMIDCFCDGDPSNNPPEAFTPRPQPVEVVLGRRPQRDHETASVHQGPGITSIWITPVVRNADSVYRYGNERAASYHGYWAMDFTTINPFFGTLADFDDLIKQAHQQKIDVILDIVVNHTSPCDQGLNGGIDDKGKLLATYDQDPQGRFHHNGRLDPKTATEADYQNKNLFDLADLNQENPQVSNYLIKAYEFWVQRGIDGIRIDTALVRLAGVDQHFHQADAPGQPPPVRGQRMDGGGGSDAPARWPMRRTRAPPSIDSRSISSS